MTKLAAPHCFLPRVGTGWLAVQQRSCPTRIELERDMRAALANGRQRGRREEGKKCGTCRQRHVRRAKRGGNSDSGSGYSRCTVGRASHMAVQRLHNAARCSLDAGMCW
eukprot:scaffold150031_cov30-Tisochrysis_lutea.AAC.2